MPARAKLFSMSDSPVSFEGATDLVCPAGTVLFRPDQACNGFVVLRSGTIRVTLTGPGGREIVLYRVKPGEICLQTFTCLTEQKPYSAEGVAETDVEAELVPIATYQRLMSEDAEFRRHIFTAVAHRFSDFEHLVESLALTGLEGRLADALLRLANADNTVTFTHEQLAAEIGSAREVVSRQLSRFARAGLVELSRGRVLLKNTELLAQKVSER